MELKQLTADLQIWQRQLTGQQLEPEVLVAEQGYRAQFSQEIEQQWRRRVAPEPLEGDRGMANSRLRDYHFAADVKFGGDLPLLATDFSHITSLELTGNAALRATEPFLQLFPNLLSLDLRNFALHEVPRAIANMPSLKELGLRHCQITLSTESQASLSALGKLESLDLSGNPLATTLDMRSMPALNDIRLSNTGIPELPIGLAGRQNLRSAIINGNQITELPENFFAIDPFIADGINLANNPLSSASRNRIKRYYVQHGNDFAVLAEPTDINQARSLFPELNTEDASHMLYKLPGTLEDGRIQLARWAKEVARLSSDLDGWSDDIPSHHPITGALLSPEELSAQREGRTAFSQVLLQLWRQRVKVAPELRANTLSVNLGFIGDLPVLDADFSHVEELVFRGSDALTVTSRFLENFSGLSLLELHNAAVGRIPQAITGMTSLEILTLNNCGVVLDDVGQATLSSLHRLETLDLANNPLGHIPNMSALPSLTHLDLSGTGIDHVPDTLVDPPRLDFALFSNNRITELPENIYDLPAHLGEGFDFSNNPLLETTRERIKTYYQKNGVNLEVPAPREDIEKVQTLYPNLSDKKASEWVYRLPGSLADGRIELARKQTELDALRRDLTVWMTDVPNHPVTGEPLDAVNLLEEQHNRLLFKEALERCWQRIARTNPLLFEPSFMYELPLMGDLPVLTADFSHVRGLYLSSQGGISPTASRFLEYFPDLISLDVRGYRLGSIPEAVFNMGELKDVNLTDCNITLTPHTINALSSMEKLRSLVLRNNPLELTPDVSQLKALVVLDFSHTGITRIPSGLFGSNVTYAYLNNNAIVDMPIELMEANRLHTANFDLRNNPFSPQSLERVAAYYYQTGVTLNIPGVPGMPRPPGYGPDVDLES